MKIQHLAVIFIIIILPISMVISTYVSNLIDVSNKEARYDNMLLNATYDSVRAYQMNTINNTFASVNSSRVRDINASVNSFFNSLSTGLSLTGYTKTELNSYIPALLFTLYDGYYIYGPRENYTRVDSGGIQYNVNDAETQYGLKPYNYYTCEYSNGSSYDIIINYTLDNYISVAGTSNGIYYSGSGYYIDPNKVESIDDGSRRVKIRNMDKYIEPETLGEYVSAYNSERRGSRTVNLPSTIAYYNYMNYKEEKYYYDDSPDTNDVSYNGIPIFYLDKNLKIYINEDMLNILADYRGCDADALRSKSLFQDVNNYWYYKEAKEFSEKFDPILNAIDLGNDYSRVVKTKSFNNNYKLETSDGNQGNNPEEFTAHTKYNYPTKRIFDYGQSGNDPELESSSFNEHRMDVIISSIEDSLSNAIANFNHYVSGNYDYRMPAISETDWEKIANNVNFVAFMQGMVVGNYKYYNHYCVVSDTKNKEFVSREAIYVQNTLSDTSVNAYRNNNYKYHDSGCKEFHKSAGTGNGAVTGYRLIDYEIESYTNESDSEPASYYMQPGTGGYECIVSRNGDSFTYDELMNGATGVNSEVRRAYISALAREKGASFKHFEILNAETIVAQ